jgi:hypothetical protein
MHRISLRTAIVLSVFGLAACSSGGSQPQVSDNHKGVTNDSLTSSDGVGAPCTPEDERNATFSGFSSSEVNVESQSPSCETGICLAAHFQGRVSCASGQPADPSDPTRADPAHQVCMTTGDNPQPVTVPVPAQTVPAADNVICSCRCDGDGDGPFCACPDGFECKHLVDAYGTSTGAQLAGSYCVKSGT